MSRRSNRIKLRIICDTVSFCFALIVVAVMILLDAPTWAWVVVGAAFWTWLSKAILREMEKDPWVRRRA